MFCKRRMAAKCSQVLLKNRCSFLLHTRNAFRKLAKRCYSDDGRRGLGPYPSTKFVKDDLWAEYHKAKAALEGEKMK